MPLFERVIFKTKLQKGNRLQVPKYIRWRYKLKPTQILQASVDTMETWRFPEKFLTRITKDGRIVVPKLILDLLKDFRKEGLEGYVFDVILEPV